MLVIIQGFYTFRLRLLNDCEQIRLKIYTFYFFALSCLLVAEVYFISGALNFNLCVQNFL